MRRPARNDTASERRRGFAVKEVLLVLAVFGCAGAGLMVVDPLRDWETATTVTRRDEVISAHEVPLGDEITCTVTLCRFSAFDSPRRPYYFNHVQFAHRDPDMSVSKMRLIEITAGVAPGRLWINDAKCKSRTLMSPDEALEDLHARGELAVAPGELSETERTSAIIDCLSWDALAVTSLHEPHRRWVPAPLQETGIMMNTGQIGLRDIHELKEFPLSKLASAIRSAALNNEWKVGDLHSLLRGDDSSNRQLTEGDEQTISRLLVHRLLEFLPEEEPNEEV